MSPKSLDWGRVYWGGTGRSRLYFQINSTQQIWLEVSGAPDFAVTAISKPEPKANGYTFWRQLNMMKACIKWFDSIGYTDIGRKGLARCITAFKAGDKTKRSDSFVEPSGKRPTLPPR